jgi:uncharacterized membrane protein YgcG
MRVHPLHLAAHTDHHYGLVCGVSARPPHVKFERYPCADAASLSGCATNCSQDQFLEADYEILANSRLLTTVLAWQSERGFGNNSSGGGSDSAAGGAGGGSPMGGSPSDN